MIPSKTASQSTQENQQVAENSLRHAVSLRKKRCADKGIASVRGPFILPYATLINRTAPTHHHLRPPYIRGKKPDGGKATPQGRKRDEKAAEKR
jgi:hypothetical protein